MPTSTPSWPVLTIRPSPWRWQVVLAERAQADVREISAWTRRQFGPQQEARYRAGISTAIGSLKNGPEHLLSRPSEELPGLRSLALAGGRHHLIYQAAGRRILVLRLLHAGQDTPRHLPD